jgi:uncharacterized membrane protein
MATPLMDRTETPAPPPDQSERAPGRNRQAIVLLVILILTGLAGMGVLVYKLEHPAPIEMFEGR